MYSRHDNTADDGGGGVHSAWQMYKNEALCEAAYVCNTAGDKSAAILFFLFTDSAPAFHSACRRFHSFFVVIAWQNRSML